ncbi:MAG TPA: DUF1934 domain-containing protein [Candidatus Limiplasma sp.]|jgi:uncharacterized beta-barrel protein YwiB (DUF1934 family)|nr:DUF1934 domain-containing protein [Candidatus Limiplasma sp.]HPR78261.1 DUF1934 domain-containing protein [Candidatus Limiplasma sp.]
MKANKGIPILISLDAQSAANSQPEDAIRLITTGELYESAEETVLRYEESLDEQEPPQKIELSLRRDGITMTRKGTSEGKMVFQKGHRYESQYHTPFGDMDLALFCTRADYQKGKNGGELTLQYQLDLGGQFAAMHDMRLHWTRKKEG